ncbi:MAG: hypothetical protein MZV65_14355 [Chromatiales bacterium]|nr:hypothetical protein [Chromatiales bacterium]
MDRGADAHHLGGVPQGRRRARSWSRSCRLGVRSRAAATGKTGGKYMPSIVAELGDVIENAPADDRPAQGRRSRRAPAQADRRTSATSTRSA